MFVHKKRIWLISLTILALAIVACTCGPLSNLTGGLDQAQSELEAMATTAVEMATVIPEDTTGGGAQEPTESGGAAAGGATTSGELPVYDAGDGYETEFVNPIELNTPVTATFTDIFKAQNWVFQGQAGMSVQIVATGGADETDTRAKLIDPSGELLAEEDDTNGTDPWIEATLPTDGLYTIRMDTWGEGAYTLIVSTDQAGQSSGGATAASGGGGAAGDPASLSPGPGVGQTPAGASGTEVTQWAIYAEASSEYGSDDWSAMQATGENDTFDCSDQATAWATATSTGQDWIRVGFASAVIPTQLNTFQSYNPGAITQIDVVDEDGNLNTVFEGTSPSPSFCPANVPFAIEDVNYPVAEVVIYIDQTITGNWSEIDAVQLIGTAP